MAYNSHLFKNETRVEIESHYKDGSHAANSVSSECSEDAMYWAMERNWGFENWMVVMIYHAIVNNNFTAEGREILRNFIRGESPRGCGSDEGKQLYEMALGPDEL